MKVNAKLFKYIYLEKETGELNKELLLVEDKIQSEKVDTKGRTNLLQSTPGYNFDDLEDMDDMLFDDLDAEGEKEDEPDEVQNLVKNFHSENKFKGYTEISPNFLERTSSEQPSSGKSLRSKTMNRSKPLMNPHNIVSELDILREQLKQANNKIEKYQGFMHQIQKAVNWGNWDMSEAKVHLSFLFASPLLRKIKNGYEQVMLLDYMNEIKDIESNLLKVNYPIKYNKAVATQRNFHSIISDHPIVLHFSGHGVVNDAQSMGSDYAFVKDKGDILLLEDEHGMSSYLFESDLKNMVKLLDANFEVVFIASCHSEFAGNVFSNAGAKHVISIKGAEKISDEAALKFAQVFYEMLFVKQYSP